MSEPNLLLRGVAFAVVISVPIWCAISISIYRMACR